MQSEAKVKLKQKNVGLVNEVLTPLITLEESIKQAWKKMAPFWPLKNLIACNPLQGFEDLPYEQAIAEGAIYFQHDTIPQQLEEINRETIKWCQAFFDEGQATINMPYRHLGLYKSWRKLAQFDDRLANINAPESPEEAVICYLDLLRIPEHDVSEFLLLLLTTLPGWASYIKYRTEWMQMNSFHFFPVEQIDYLAIRLATTYALWPEARELIAWHRNIKNHNIQKKVAEIVENEKKYDATIFSSLHKQASLASVSSMATKDAQLVFCIDVRSEPFRRAIESLGRYETYGFAGFFGIPVKIDDETQDESYASCPVLLEPKHLVYEKLDCSLTVRNHFYRNKKIKHELKDIYQSLKHNFTTPFALVESLGLWSGLLMMMKTFSPSLVGDLAARLKSKLTLNVSVSPQVKQDELGGGISFTDQCQYAKGALKMMGLTDHFAPVVVFLGHGSQTNNNAYASGLDCGACGGHSGGGNARILSAILNNLNVRSYLKNEGIIIPSATTFVAGEHNTTTDQVEIFSDELDQLKEDLRLAQQINCQSRYGKLTNSKKQMDLKSCVKAVEMRSVDWAETRPEWALARNATFIVGPRSLTKDINLDGRSFLHSYQWQIDGDGSILTVILTAPMVVAQWINSQYLFSALDNVAYGSGSKITQNITGKLGLMQGNASDLMHGLPLQSVAMTDSENYHEEQRLLTVIYAPRQLITNVITNQAVLKKLFGNGWVRLACIDPLDGCIYLLSRDLNWDIVRSL